MVKKAIIAMLTDFGTRDGYVGAMKGVLHALSPNAALTDISHEIAPQDVVGAAHTLARCYRYFPNTTIFLVVVDPGVGINRRPLAVEAGGCRFIASDNDVLSRVLQSETGWRAVTLTNQRYWRDTPSETFHGRGIFAPIGARWANGVDFTSLGDEISDLVFLSLNDARWDAAMKGLRGEVSDVDRFGNLLTNIGAHFAVRKCVAMTG